MTKLPTLFISHGGGPWPFMDRSLMGDPESLGRMEKWLRGIRETLPETPKAIIAVSGHWEASDEIRIMAHPKPPMLFDYRGFPPETYALNYPAPGSTSLAIRIQEALKLHEIPSVLDPQRGFDHGVFIPFMLMFPEAQIPVVQISIRSDLDPEFHISLGESLENFRYEGVLVVASGMSYHNLRGFGPQAEAPSLSFDTWLNDAVTDTQIDSRTEKLLNWTDAPSARAAHPREDHLIPLMVAAGAAGNDLGERIFSDRIMGAWTSAYRFG